VSRLGIKKQEKSLTDLIIERSVELYGYTPDERSDNNVKWMLENGYLNRQPQKHGRDSRGRRSK
jgi:hypothetical protein